jgi:exo-1,4-beta-D-glucosaminidase
MYEGYSRNKYVSTGVIQWMLNNAWPEMIWHLYDYYLNTGGSYFGAKKGCEPLHVQYSYDDHSIWVVNSLYEPQSNFQVNVQVYSFYGEVLYESTHDIATILGDSSVNVTVIPAIENLTTTYFVRLALSEDTQEIISRNFYWLSTSPDVLDWADSNFFRTPCTSYSDFTMLESLPQIQLELSSKTQTVGNYQQTTGKTSAENVVNNC